MSNYTEENSTGREPWELITEILLSEIAAGRYKHPFLWGEVWGLSAQGRRKEMSLLVHPRHVMAHLAADPGLREQWEALPVKSARIYKHQLAVANVILGIKVERVINHRRHRGLVALVCDRMVSYGLSFKVPEDARRLLGGSAAEIHNAMF